MALNDYHRGYQQALKDINQPLPVITCCWNPSECPRCERDFSDFEPCNDGYYQKAVHIERCPFCGQKLDWDI